MVLEEYKEIVGFAASISAIAQMFSPCFMLYGIVKKKCSTGVDVTPFIGGLVMSLLMLQHGSMLNDTAMITVNVFGFVLNIIYFTIYYCYSNNRSNLMAQCGKAAVLVGTLLIYARVEEKERAEFNFGLIVTVFMLSLIASPLASLNEIIRSKSTSSLPFPLILSGSVVTFLWLLYGIIIKNVFLQIQNTIGFVLCVIQLSLFIIYPSKPKKLEKKDK